MCFYCGCREIPLLRDLIGEHEQITDLGAELVDRLRSGASERARELMARLADVLDTHWQGEEQGLFAEMGRGEEYATYIADLVREHRELHGLLSEADPDSPVDRERLTAAMEELHGHIAKEEDGLFPASLTALAGDQWERAMAAWRAAHAVPVAP